MNSSHPTQALDWASKVITSHHPLHIHCHLLQPAPPFNITPFSLLHFISRPPAPLLLLPPCFDLLQGIFPQISEYYGGDKAQIFPLSTTSPLQTPPFSSRPLFCTRRIIASRPPRPHHTSTPLSPLPSETQDPPTSPEASHANRQVAPPSQERPLPEPESPISPSEMTASSFSTASESSLKPAPLSLPLPPQQAWKRPRRAFVRHGLGGAGNYHKRPDSSPNSDYPSFLSSLFGTFGNKKRKTRKYPEADSTGCSQYSSQALPLGAAEVLKRKILGQGAGGKTSTSSDRS